VHKFLPLHIIDKFEGMMRRRHVSEVARSPRGFLTAYKAVNGRSRDLDSYWVVKREGFVARHTAQVEVRGEPLFDVYGNPTRRHLAMIAWAFSPHPEKIANLAARLGRG